MGQSFFGLALLSDSLAPALCARMVARALNKECFAHAQTGTLCGSNEMLF